jgi:hypothetical protein
VLVPVLLAAALLLWAGPRDIARSAAARPDAPQPELEDDAPDSPSPEPVRTPEAAPERAREDVPDVLAAIEPETAVIGKSWSFSPKLDRFPEWDLRCGGGTLPEGIRVHLNIVAGVAWPPEGMYVFTLEATKEERVARRTYTLRVVGEPLRLRRVIFEDTVRDRRVGEGDGLVVCFDGTVEIVDDRAPAWRFADGTRPFGAGARLLRRDDSVLEFVLGRGASFDFAGPGPVLVVGGQSVCDLLGAPLPEQRAQVQEPLPFVHGTVGGPILPVPLSSVDPVDPLLRVTGLPEGLRYEGGCVVGTPVHATQPSRDYPAFVVEDGGWRREVRYDIYEAIDVDPGLRILSIDPTEPRVGDVVRVRHVGGGDVILYASGIPNGWWKPGEDAAWLPTEEGETLFFLDRRFEGVAEARLGLIGHRRRCAPVPVRLRQEVVLPDRTPRVTDAALVPTAEGTFLAFRGFWLAGPSDLEKSVRLLVDGREVEPFRLSRRFGAARLPSAESVPRVTVVPR